jgi:hypothetical protein
LANFVPKPEPLHGYAETNGVVVCATAMYCGCTGVTAPDGELAGPVPVALVALTVNV